MENKKNETIELDENQFLEAIKEAGLESSLSNYAQKIGDKRVDQGIKSFQKNQETKNLSDSEKITNLENELKEMKNGKTKDDIKTKIINELKAQGLNEGLLKYVKTEGLDDQSKIAEAVTGLKDDLLNAKQAEIDQKLKGNTPPVKGEPGKGGDSDLDNYVESKNKGEDNSPFKGKI